MAIKRPQSFAEPTNARRMKPTPTAYVNFQIDNVKEGEVIHQRCLIVTGLCHQYDNSTDDFVSVVVTDCFDQASAAQNWPVTGGKWRALVILATGVNDVSFQLNHSGGVAAKLDVRLTYQPLLETPPLHLAIMVAKDSPMLIDCPDSKRGAISTTHSSLEAAVRKLRMAAYMWQALTAEDLQTNKHLGRRSFRLEEEWGADTTTSAGLQLEPGSATMTGLVPRVHIVRSEKTVAELRDPDVAQQNESGSRTDRLHKDFENALVAYGSPFNTGERPVVAGLILDSHYSRDQDLILGHAALGCHNPNGLSLGVFGSHTTFSWPRFLEEVPACLLDLTHPGRSVGNDNGECNTMSETCFIGQGAMLHEVGHAFGTDHTTGIMARGYAQDWPRNFLAHQDHHLNEAIWDLQDALRFKTLAHFRLPGDQPFSETQRKAPIVHKCYDDEFDSTLLRFSCEAGIARIRWLDAVGNDIRSETFNNAPEGVPDSYQIYRSELENRFSGEKRLGIAVMGMHGRERIYRDCRKLLTESPIIRIPNSSVVLTKQSVDSSGSHNDQRQEFISWALLLHRKGQDNKLHRASSIDLRVGCILDGAVVRYDDSHHTNCGPAVLNGSPHTFGGHASQEHILPRGAEIIKMEVNKAEGSWGGCLEGIRMTLSSGESWGELNDYNQANAENGAGVSILEPERGEKIVGFYGQSDTTSGFAYEFGIITAPRDVVLPEAVYDMPEFQGEDRGGRKTNIAAYK